MNLNQSCYAIVSYKIKCDFLPLCDITRFFFFFNERIVAATSNVQGMSAKNDSLLQIEEIVRIYANSKYLDRNVRWVHFILAEYTSGNSVSGCSHVNPSSCSLVRRVQDLIRVLIPAQPICFP